MTWGSRQSEQHKLLRRELRLRLEWHYAER